MTTLTVGRAPKLNSSGELRGEQKLLWSSQILSCLQLKIIHTTEAHLGVARSEPLHYHYYYMRPETMSQSQERNPSFRPSLTRPGAVLPEEYHLALREL